jgi:hypothetical protein
MVTAVKRPAGETREKWLRDLTPDNATRQAPDPTQSSDARPSNALDDKDIQNRLISMRYPCSIAS